MNLQEKVQAIKNDVDSLKKGIESVVTRYPLPIAMLVRGNKTGLSVTIESDFDKIPEAVFTRKPLGQV